MKKCFSLALILLFSLNILAEGIDLSRVGYHITSTKTDENIKNNQAVLEITFFDYQGKKLEKIPAITSNGKVITSTKVKDTYTLILKPGMQLFKFSAKDHFDVLTDTINILKSQRIKMDVYFESSVNIKVSLKPVIYFYPEKPTEINAHLDVKGEMSFTYPLYNEGWNFTADPNGTIHMNEKEYNYLFWEGPTKFITSKLKSNEGAFVTSKNLMSFFETSLTQMGLNTKEQQDFITFWYPLMVKNKNNYIHFIFNDEYNEYANLQITPKPDNTFRVFMIWAPAAETENITLQPQTFPTFKREGFSVLEWGGTEFDNFDKLIE